MHSTGKEHCTKSRSPVILLKNIGKRLFNGTRGKVLNVSAAGPPIINFNGKLVTLKWERFEIFDKEQHKVVTCRVQYPSMLAFALTLSAVEVDCFSFFAAGQMGVAIERTMSTDDLCVRDFNMKVVQLNHSRCVFEFYHNCRTHTCFDFDEPEDQPLRPDDQPPRPDDQPSTTRRVRPRPHKLQRPMLPQVECPWSVQEFI